MNMNPLQLIGMMKNPQQFFTNMFSNSQLTQNSIAMNALSMAKQGNMPGVEELARNLCKQKGINADEAVENIRKQYGQYFGT